MVWCEKFLLIPNGEDKTGRFFPMREFCFLTHNSFHFSRWIYFNIKKWRAMGGVLASGERDSLGSFKSHQDRIRFAFDRAEALGLQWGLDEFLWEAGLSLKLTLNPPLSWNPEPYWTSSGDCQLENSMETRLLWEWWVIRKDLSALSL